MAAEHGWEGLRSAARATVFRDWGVTPELTGRLLRRLAETPAASVRGSGAPGVREASARRVRWGPWTAAVVGALVLALNLGVPPRPDGLPGPDVPPVDTGTRVRLVLTDENGVPVGGLSVPEVQPGHQVILNAELSLLVPDADAAMNRLRSLTDAAGGYVADATINTDADGSRHGRAVLRVPAGRYGGTLAEFTGLGEVQAQRQWTQDVTDRYTDLETRIRVLTRFEQRLEQLSAEAESFDDWLKLANQSNETRAEIERLTGQLKQMTNQVDYSTIAVTLTQRAEGAPTGSASLWSDMGRSFTRSAARVAALGRRAVVGAAALAPFAALPALGAALWAGFRRRRRRSGET